MRRRRAVSYTEVFAIIEPCTSTSAIAVGMPVRIARDSRLGVVRHILVSDTPPGDPVYFVQVYGNTVILGPGEFVLI